MRTKLFTLGVILAATSQMAATGGDGCGPDPVLRDPGFDLWCGDDLCIWKVVTGELPGRRDPRQITLFDSVGFAIEDFSALRYVRERLSGTAFYQNLDMIADPDDPRDLFGMLLRAKEAASPSATPASTRCAASTTCPASSGPRPRSPVSSASTT